MLFRSGKVRALGITSLQRSPLLPEVPTVNESGVKGFTYATWQAIYAPRNTPRPIIDRLHAEMVKAVNDPAVKDKTKAEVDAALAKGVFGSPYVVVDGEPFWGIDRFDQIEKWLTTGGW